MATLEAVYEDGVFRPLEPVALNDGDRVTVMLPERKRLLPARMLDQEFIRECRAAVDGAPSIEAVREILRRAGPLSQTIIDQREERFEE